MMVEFVGLPGCGKSTLAGSLETLLKKDGIRAQGMRNAAVAAMARMQGKIGFLRHRQERTSLYGCLAFAQTHPELFEWVFRTSREDFNFLLWNMETVAQMGILEKHGPADLVVLNDEGFLQRFAGNFIGKKATKEIDEVSALLPRDFMTIYLMVPPKLAQTRAKERRKGIPLALRADTDAKVLTQFRRYDKVLRRWVDARKALGCAVLELDASGESEEVTAAAMNWLRPQLAEAK